MTRGRRAVLLAGLAILLGTLAASDVSGREAQLRRSLQPLVDVVVARSEIKAGARISTRDLTVRRVPARFAPMVALEDPGQVVGRRAAVAIAAGADVTAAQLHESGAELGLRGGERSVDVIATGSAAAIVPGTRVDVLVTTDDGGTRLALENAEVLTSRSAPPAEGSSARVVAGLRVTVRQAVYLTAAQSFAREIRLLPRGASDARAAPEGLSVGPLLDPTGVSKMPGHQ